MTQIVEKNTVVSISYSILNSDGEVMEQSDLPVDYLHGVDGRLFPKVEMALDGKAIGESVDVTLSADEGFGQPDPSLIFVDDIENAPPEFRIVGATPSFENEQGEPVEMIVTKIEDGKITIDGNHPFAGKAITFHVTVMGIRAALPDELSHGEVMPSDAPGMMH